MKKIFLIINILIITSISLISYAVEENNTIEINTNKEQIKKGEEIELNNRYLWDGLEFDPTSYDADKNYSTDLYFSTPYKRDTQIRTKPSDYRLLTTLKEDEVGLYKSDDCGENFTLIINDPKVADGIIRFTDDGKLYIGNQYGLFLINTQTNKIEKEYKEFSNNPNASVEASTKGVTGLDVVGNVIYVQTWDGIYTLENDTITKITNDTYDTRWPQMLTVSKSNPNHMVYEFRGSVTNYFTTLVNVTFDGGKTWTDTGLKAKYEESSTYYSSLQSITNPNVLFAQEYYSKDKGYTWQEMNGCVAVYTYNYTGKKELYGANKDGHVVVSYDNGDTWKIVTKNKFSNSSTSEKIYDLAYDHVNNYMYMVDRETYSWGGIERIYKYDINNDKCTRIDVPRDTERGFMRIRSIAVDPKSTSVIYVGGAGDYFSASTGLLRSVDGGDTWRVLTTANNPNYEEWATNKGGYEVSCIGIDHRTGKVWLASGCYGYSTINPTYQE